MAGKKNHRKHVNPSIADHHNGLHHTVHHAVAHTPMAGNESKPDNKILPAVDTHHDTVLPGTSGPDTSPVLVDADNGAPEIQAVETEAPAHHDDAPPVQDVPHDDPVVVIETSSSTGGITPADTSGGQHTSSPLSTPAPVAVVEPAPVAVVESESGGGHGGGGTGSGGGHGGGGGGGVGAAGGLNHNSLDALLDPAHHRQIDGTGTSPTTAHNGVSGGAVGAEYVRLTGVHYQNDDGHTAMHTHVDAGGHIVADTAADAPAGMSHDDATKWAENARDISNAVGAQSHSEASAEGLNDLFWAYGQWVDHGLDLQPDGGPSIKIPTADGLNHGSISIARTITDVASTTANGYNSYTNPLTAAEDASQLYGSEKWLDDLLRDPLSGKMMTAQAAQAQHYGAAPLSHDGRDLLPTWGQFKAIAQSHGYTVDTTNFGDLFHTGHDVVVDNGSITGPDGHSHAVLAGGMLQAAYFGKNPGHTGVQAENDLYVSGDVRVNENSALTTLHTLFLREHNYQVDHLTQLYNAAGMHLTKDQIFNAAKEIVEGEYQHIINTEFVPAMLGHEIEDKKFDPTVNPTISLEFSTAAYRFGHSMLSDSIERLKADGTHATDLTLGDAFINPYELNNSAGNNMQGIIAGLHDKVAQNMDEHLVDTVRNGLLGAQDDLFARNIERNRDHGIGTLNQVRHDLGLHEYTDWNDFAAHMVHPENVMNFESVYASVNDVDLYVGGLAESHVGGGTLGETFNFIVEKQFAAEKHGDEFYYLNRFEGNALSYVKSGDLQTLFERNYGVDIGSDAFHGHTAVASNAASQPDHII